MGKRAWGTEPRLPVAVGVIVRGRIPARGILALAALGLVGLSATVTFAAGARDAHPHTEGQVIARQFVRPEVGAFLRSTTGVSIFVPPGVMARAGYVTIRSEGSHVYDVHIGPRWKGTVAVSLPLRRRPDIIVHDVGGIWLAEGQHPGQRTVWVTQLSWFTTLISKAAGKVSGTLCLSFSLQEIADCVATKLGDHIDGRIVSWIESKLPQNCLVQLTEAGVTGLFGGPKGIVLSIVKQAVSGACVGGAGEVGYHVPPNPTSPPPLPPAPNPSPGPPPTPTPAETPLPPAQTWSEQETPNHPVNTFTDYHNASGLGTQIASAAWVQVSCKVYDPTIASVNPDGYWYRIASAPWSNAYYAPANTFMNGDTFGGPYTHNTDFAVADC